MPNHLTLPNLNLTQDFSKFNVIKPKLLETVDRMLSQDIAVLMGQIPLEEERNKAAGNKSVVKVMLFGVFGDFIIIIIITSKIYIFIIIIDIKIDL